MFYLPAVKSIHDDDTFEPLAPDASSSSTETTTFETASDLSSNSEDLEETELGDFLMDAFSSYEDQFPLVVDADLDAFLGDMVGVWWHCSMTHEFYIATTFYTCRRNDEPTYAASFVRSDNRTSRISWK